MRLSVIIPTRNEQEFIARAIESAWEIDASEVIVADGGSNDQTVSIAMQMGAKVVESPSGRGNQMNIGAKEADGDVLLFLHADNWLSQKCKSQIDLAMHSGKHFCCFRQRIDAEGWIYRLIEKGNALRARFQKLPYGDQGICVTRKIFDRVNGFDEIPLMEDVSFAKKVVPVAAPHLLEGPIHVSHRRWKQNGPIRQTFANWLTMLKYRMGVCPKKLAQGYYRENLEQENTSDLRGSESAPASME